MKKVKVGREEEREGGTEGGRVGGRKGGKEGRREGKDSGRWFQINTFLVLCNYSSLHRKEWSFKYQTLS